ncbi:MAG TPA: 16S rRNA (guanine(527)-N(7))-methyltransferase RsmG [Anaeromyxobacteraceae bacterium]|nr:16S rRNA (guanine(527)-N(7))-methyltransferase RsmG [Anaeromyxobacteraceae bacterium]
MQATFDEVLGEGLAAIGVEVDAVGRGRLAVFAERLLRWNARVNLTAVRDLASVAEVHLVDSLGLLRSLGGAKTVLDVGSGAGLPGVVLACARPELAVTCCDSAHKKVAFVKVVSAELGLEVRARAVRAQGDPDAEGLPRCEVVVSRALAEPARWLPLGAHYLAPGGYLFAMLGREAEAGVLESIGRRAGLGLRGIDRFRLPRSGALRAVARFSAGAARG